LGAQDVYVEDDGAFTGEVSTAMLRDCHCEWALAGHSERRHVLGEGDELINRKVRKVLADGLKVILCVGETREQRDANETDAVNIRQIREGLKDVSADDMNRVVIAYEPVWAIGTGLTATPDDAQNAHHVIREEVRSLYGDAVADAVRIQYGGSVKPGNAAELFSQPDIDGGLIGGASLKADDFGHIVRAASRG
ncbi:MAG: triose-phosphate isomerase, partial [Planctomycetota bacterium]